MLHILKKNLSAEEIKKVYPDLVDSVAGEGSFLVQSLAPYEESLLIHSLVFAHSPAALKGLKDRQVGVLVLPSKFKSESPIAQARAIIYSPSPEWLFAEVLSQFVQETPYRAPQFQGVHPACVIDPTAVIHPTATVGPFVVIGPGVQIGENSYIGAHTVIEDRAWIGQNVVIHPLVYIGHQTIIHDYVEIHASSVIGKEGFGYAHNKKGEHRRIPHLGRVILQEKVQIGAGTTIDRGTMEDTVIGQGSMFDNQCHIAHNNIIGKHGLFTSQFTMAGSSKIGDHFACGGLTVISGHLEVGDQVRLAARTGVSKDLLTPGEYGGWPTQPIKDYLRVQSSQTHVPELRRKVQQLWKKVFGEEGEE